MIRPTLVLVLLAWLALGPPIRTGATLGATTRSPANTVATGTSVWFALNGSGTSICAGANGGIACPFGTRTKTGVTVTATIAVTAKSAGTYTVSVVDGTGPAGISTIVSASFLSNGTATAALAAGSPDTIDLILKIKGGTPVGTYTGTLVITDMATGVTAAIPISVTRG